MANNYGDVALNLSPDWDRRKFADKKFIIWTVGHKGGVSDLRLKKEPEKRHQFAWCDPRYKDELDINRSNGYVVVKKEDWDKTEDLWEWNAEDKCVCSGQIAMARPASLFFEAQKAKEQELSRRRKKPEEEQELAEEDLRRAVSGRRK